MKILILFIIFYTFSFSNKFSCTKCHNMKSDTTSDIHFQINMLSEIKKYTKILNEPTCTLCHGGNSRTMDFKKAHLGSPKKHPGGLLIFTKNPEENKKVIKRTCAMCHDIESL